MLKRIKLNLKGGGHIERFTDWIDDAKTEVSIVSYKMRDAMLRLAAYEDTGLTPEEIMDGRMLTGWIPVAEQDADYLVTMVTPGYFKGHPYTNWLCWYGDDQEWTDTDGDTIPGQDTVIAWMPIPEPHKPPALPEAGERAGKYADAPTLRPAT